MALPPASLLATSAHFVSLSRFGNSPNISIFFIIVVFVMVQTVLLFTNLLIKKVHVHM